MHINILAITATLSIATALSGCTTGNTTAPQVAAPMQSGELSLSRGPMPIRYRAKGPLTTSLIAKAKPKSPVLFITDSGTGEAYMLDLTTLSLMGKITGFVQPEGACSGNKGNVWIADTAANTVYEVTHQGRLENEFTEKPFPLSCAWDPTSGDLAVTNQTGSDGAAGNISVYQGALSTSYSTPKVFYYNFAAYDGSGNLFADGRTSRGTFELMEVPRGSAKMQVLKVGGGKIYFPGMVQWDSAANDLIVGDQSCGNAYSSCLYTLTVANQTATITSTIKLQNSKGAKVCDLVEGDAYDGQLYGSDYNFCDGGPSTTYAWPYPTGGAPTLSNKKIDTSPVGAVVSP